LIGEAAFVMSAAQNHRDTSTPTGHGDAQAPPARPVPRSRVGGLWVAAVVFSLVLLLLLIFVLENGQRAEVSFFGTHAHLPMGVALLLAAVFGILLVALPGTARILQLRLLGRRRAPRVAATASTAPLPSFSDDTAGRQERR
jgi:uncharacterized integral membrane protein